MLIANSNYSNQYSIKYAHITKEVLQKHCKPYLKDVLNTQFKMKWTPRWLLEGGARKLGYDDLAIKCICLVDDFFEQDKTHIEKLIKQLSEEPYYLEYINDTIAACSVCPQDISFIAHVCHKKHIETIKKITLPEHVAKEDLIQDPLLYKQIIDKKHVDKKERFMLTAAGLFVQYWFKNKCTC